MTMALHRILYCIGLLLFSIIPTNAFISSPQRSASSFVIRTQPHQQQRQQQQQEQQRQRRLHQLMSRQNLFDDSNKDSDDVILAPGLISSMLLPLAEALEETSGGWALTYADLKPETERTAIGQAFLATNVAYTIMGLLLLVQGGTSNVWLGSITECASVASFAYHYNQLANPEDSKLVRLVLLLDYVVAALCLGTTAWYVATDFSSMPVQGLVACALATVFLLLSWVWEKGLPYCFNHGMWHLLGAYGGLLIGQAHATAATTTTVASIMMMTTTTTMGV